VTFLEFLAASARAGIVAADLRLLAAVRLRDVVLVVVITVRAVDVRLLGRGLRLRVQDAAR
jgi:hypothetical protein